MRPRESLELTFLFVKNRNVFFLLNSHSSCSEEFDLSEDLVEIFFIQVI